MSSTARKGSGGDDILAIALLSKDIQSIKGIADPPLEYSAIVKFRAKTEEVFKKAQKTTNDVNQYAEKINKKNEELRDALKVVASRVHDSMLKLVDRSHRHEHGRETSTATMPAGNTRTQTQTIGRQTQIVQSSRHVKSDGQDTLAASGPSAEQLKCLNELLQMDKMRINLEEAILQNQIMVDKMKNNVDLTNEDFETLTEKINNLQTMTKKDFDDDKRRKDEEERKRKAAEKEKRRRDREEKQRREDERQRQREESDRHRQEREQAKERNRQEEEEEKTRKEEEERLRKQKEEELKRERERLRREEAKRKLEEEKERKRQEEEERLRLEEEERLRKEEEERLRREEEERLKREEEERRRREEEERRRMEEEERRRREEEARQKRIEEEQRRKREQQERLEAERREMERRRRLDPNNWEPIVYRRHDGDDFGDRSHHQGVCCVVTAVQDALQEEDIQCLASDEAEDFIQALGDGEKVVSSVVSIDSKKDRLNFEAPMRALIPHQPVTNFGEELSLKISVDGKGWEEAKPVELSSRSLTEESIRLVGADLNDFDSARILVVARTRGQNIIVDSTGTSQYSSNSKNVKLFFPRDAYNEPTEVKLSVKLIPDDVRLTIEAGSDCAGSIITTGPLVSLDTPTPPMKQIEIDLMTSSDSVRSQTTFKGKTYQLFKTNKGAWQMADVEYKGKGKDRTISLPAAKSHYSVIEIEATPSTSADDVVQAASALYDTMNRSVVRLIVRQKEQNPDHVMIHCVRREAVFDRLKELDAMGYTAGPDTSHEFYLTDGQRLKLSCSGNIETSTEERHCVILSFFAYMDTAKLELIVQVKDQYKQRDLREYVGNVHCQVLPLGSTGRNGDDYELKMELPISLPKGDRVPLFLKTVPVRFPHYWSALTVFLAWKLTDISADNIDWRSVLSDLLGGQGKMQRLHSKAKARSPESSDLNVCRVMLEDWAKATNVNEDKLRPVMATLEKHGLQSLGRECAELVEYHRDYMTDATLHDLAERIPEDPIEIGARLGLSEATVKKCVAENPGSVTHQLASLLMEWRHSLGAIELGTKAMEFLRSIN